MTEKDPVDATSVSAASTPSDPASACASSDADHLEAFHHAQPTKMIMLLVFVASISGFMFGYDTGYVSSALVAIGTDLDEKELTSGDKEFITSATSLGALIAAVFAGSLADWIGRRWTLAGSNVLFIIGSAIQVGSHTVWTMIGGRFVMGFGVGIGSLIAPLYIAEIAPTTFRGRLVIINCFCITGGQLIAYGIGAGLVHVSNGWRILVGLSIIPPVVQMVTFCFLPDTPRWLLLHNRVEEASKVLKKTHAKATDAMVDAKVREILADNEVVRGTAVGGSVAKRTWAKIKEIHTVPSNFRGLIIACGLQGIQQFTGFNSLMYFSATIFEAVGFNDATAVSIIVAGTNFAFTVAAFFIIDTVGRRNILLIGMPGMCASLVLNAIAFHFFGLKFEDGVAIHNNENGEISGWGIVIVIAMMLYVACYAVGIGNVPWQQSELFPMSVRGVGVSYATCTNWAGSLVISSTYLTMMERITPPGTFGFFAALCAVATVAVFFCYPELSGLELEETQEMLQHGFNVKKSIQLSRERKRAKKTRRQRLDSMEKAGQPFSVETVETV